MSNIGQSELINIQPKESLSKVEAHIVRLCKRAHRFFDNIIWRSVILNNTDNLNIPKAPSFHNDKHIEATIKAADILLQKAISAERDSATNKPKDKNNDPFDLIGHLKQYNEANNTNIEEEEMASCIKIAFAGHDLGDIGQINPETGKFEYFENGYHPGAESEKRSAEILEQRLTALGLKKESRDFIIYLIKETTYDPKKPPDPEVPFARFMRFVDFVGNGFFNEDPDRFLGLILEMYNWETNLNKPRKSQEKSIFSLNLRNFFNMVPQEFINYFDSEEDRNAILAIWDKKDWTTINNYPEGVPLPQGDTMPELGIELGLVNIAAWLRKIYGPKK